ncbi:hypothetical protein PG984_009743 [Apiospora sp. TS-2023a]
MPSSSKQAAVASTSSAEPVPATASDAHDSGKSDSDEFYSDDSDAETLDFKDGIGRLLQGYNDKNRLYPLQLDIEATKA